MNLQLIIIGMLFAGVIFLTIKALYHRNHALKTLKILEAEMPLLKASVGLTTRYEREKKRRRFNRN